MAFTPYSTLQPLAPISVIQPITKPNWIENDLDKERILSYQMYEQIYWNVPETFKLVARSSESRPIYIPNAKTIIETVNRFTATGFDFRVEINPLFAGGTRQDPILAKQFMRDFFTREKFGSKFAGNKRYGIMRGDWCWHVKVNPLKPQGSRVSIETLDPGSYFPIWHPNDLDKIIGVRVVDQIMEEDEPVISRLTYMKPLDANFDPIPGGFITMEHGIYDPEEWEDPEAAPIRAITATTVLNGITSLPVYHIKNFDEPGNPFGSSELRGIERVIAGVNQAVSDQELALAMEGLGFYWTDAPPPVDPITKRIMNWVLGPGRVAEIPPGRKFERVQGIGKDGVEATLKHVEYLEKSMQRATGASDAAIGMVDVTVEVSGVALALQMGPLLATTGEKDVGITEVMGHIFHDLAAEWFPVYEGFKFDGLTVVPTIGEKLPVDRAEVLAELEFMVTNKIASAAYARTVLSEKLGYTFPEGMGLDVVQERAALAEAEDPFGMRLGTESTNDGGVTPDGNNPVPPV